MRALMVAFASGAALAAASVQAAPLSPKPSAIQLGIAPPMELVRDGLRTRLASDPLARPIGLLALG